MLFLTPKQQCKALKAYEGIYLWTMQIMNEMELEMQYVKFYTGCLNTGLFKRVYITSKTAQNLLSLSSLERLLLPTIWFHSDCLQVWPGIATYTGNTAVCLTNDLSPFAFVVECFVHLLSHILKNRPTSLSTHSRWLQFFSLLPAKRRGPTSKARRKGESCLRVPRLIRSLHAHSYRHWGRIIFWMGSDRPLGDPEAPVIGRNGLHGVPL